MFNDEVQVEGYRKSHIAGGTALSGAGVRAVPDVSRDESLASVSPRVVELAYQVGQYTQVLESSFGISMPEKESSVNQAAQQPTLMNTLLSIESMLRQAAYSLERSLRHING